MNPPTGCNPTLAWEAIQRDIARRTSVKEIADFICSRAPWARSQQFLNILRRDCGLRPNSLLLDAGCATGQLAFAAAVHGGCRVTLLDYSEEALDFAKEVAQELRSRGANLEASFVRGDIEALSFCDRFDIVTNQGVLEHWFAFEERLHIVREMAKCAKPGGIVIVWVPNNHNPLYRKWIQTNIEVEEKAFLVTELDSLFVSAGLESVRVFPVTAYKSFVHFTALSRIKWLGGTLWLLEKTLPSWILGKYLLNLGYELIAIGRRPLRCN